jgi:hypothetical protein
VIQSNAGPGIIVEQSSTAGIGGASPDQMVVADNTGGGVFIESGSHASVSSATVENNGSVGISAFRGSSAAILDSIVRGNPEGVSINTDGAATLRGSTISTSSTEDDALFIGWGSAARMNGGNTITSPVSAIFLRQGATLNQRNGDDVNGRVTVDGLSNAEFRNVSIRGPLEIVDHSLVRFRDQSGGSSHVSLRGNASVSRDSGLNFLRDAGEQRVRVVGNITCADTESSLSAPSTNVVIIGKTTGCTGYNNVSN